MRILLIGLAWVVLTGGVHAQTPIAERFVSKYASEHHFSGTVLVHRPGRPDYVRSFGLANRAFQIPNNVDTRYWIASITKLFTSTLILQLQEQRRVDLDATIHTYLPDYSGPGGEKVTLRELLHHTSGIDNPDKVQSLEDALRDGLPMYQTPMTSDQLLARFASGPLVNVPGTVFSYNNAEYIILGKIIERVTGKRFAQALDEGILRPTGMANSGMLGGGRVVSRLAPTYLIRPGSDELKDDLPVYQENWFASGSMYSTAGDLLRFADALFGARLISKKSLGEMIEPGLDDYGFGAWSYDATVSGRKVHIVKRPGRIMGAQTQLYHVMSPDITIILLANTGSTDLDEFVSQIGKNVLAENASR